MDAQLRDWQAHHPEVVGTNGMMRSLYGETKILEKLQSRRDVASESLIGVRNNIEAIEGELRIARRSHGVTAVGKKFRLDENIEGVEVDVVANRGSAWIEVKNTASFGLRSNSWKQLQSQVRNLLRAAKQNPTNYQAPKIKVVFLKAVGWEVAVTLERMGVEVVGRRVRVPEPDIVPISADSQKDND